MHHIFVTPGIVLSKHAVGEAHTQVYVLTEELGLLRVSARTTRVERSKLRYGLEAGTVARFSFVKGRHEWRLTGVEGVSRKILHAPTASRAAFGRVAKLLLRLIPGSVPMSEIYTVVTDTTGALCDTPEGHVPALEALAVLRVLFLLGYVPHTPELQTYAQGEITAALLERAAKDRMMLVRAINTSLAHTGL